MTDGQTSRQTRDSFTSQRYFISFCPQEFLRSPVPLPPEGLSVHGVDLAEFKAKILSPSEDVLKAIRLQRLLTRSELNLAAHDANAAVVSNGRVLRLTTDSDISVDDFALIERILIAGMEKIQTELFKLASKEDSKPEVDADLYMRLASLMFPTVQKEKRHQVKGECLVIHGCD